MEEKNASIAFLTIALLGAALAGYNSMDLILKDYITQQGIYDSYNRGREVYILELFFSVDNSDEFCYAFTWDVDNLEIGKKYQFTHSKRTNMLLSVEEIDF